jgi:beta-glucanase (GH16 family)
MMRVPRAAALALVLAGLGLLSVCATSSAPTEAATLRAGAPATTTTSAAKGPDGPKGHWRLVFSDHFTGSTLDTANWSTCYFFGCTDKGNNELEWYEASQVTVHNGTAS